MEEPKAVEAYRAAKKAVAFMVLGKEPLQGEPVSDYVKRVEREIREAGARERQRVPAG